MILAPFVLFFAPPQAPSADAGAIMARVAANQDRAQKMRSAFIYHQDVLVRLNHTNGKLAQEAHSEYTVTPGPNGVSRERTSFTGKYVEHGKVVEYHDPTERREHVRIDIDGSVVMGLADDMAKDESKDGIPRDMFPLTAREQSKYEFRLEGTEDYRGTQVYRITFEPRKDVHEEDSIWAGEALIDVKECQPVLVTTHQSFKMPVLVKTLLGTNLEHMGFKVAYKKFDEGLWFPVTYGGELKVRAVFFYARRIGISLRNSGFQRADVNSSITYKTVE